MHLWASIFDPDACMYTYMRHVCIHICMMHISMIRVPVPDACMHLWCIYVYCAAILGVAYNKSLCHHICFVHYPACMWLPLNWHLGLTGKSRLYCSQYPLMSAGYCHICVSLSMKHAFLWIWNPYLLFPVKRICNLFCSRFGIIFFRAPPNRAFIFSIIILAGG